MGSCTDATPERLGARAILRPAELDRSMVRVVRPATGSAAVWVRHVWSLQWDRPQPPSSSALIPHPTLHVTIEAGGPDEVRHGHLLPQALLHGVVTRGWSRPLPAPGWVVGLHLQPGAGKDLLGTAVSTWTDRVVRWDQGWPGPAWDLDAVWTARSPEERAEAMAAVAAACLPRREPSPGGLAARRLAELAESDQSLTTVSALAERAGLPVRRLQRLCRDHLGVTPHWLLRRARVHDAHELLGSTELEIADIAHRLGWFDQAHLTRDFTAIAGVPPARLRRERSARERAPR